MTDAPTPSAVAPVNPGKTMGIVALVLSILPFQLIGVILGFVALNQSKKAGQKNGFAVAAIIIGLIGLVIGVIVAIGAAVSGAALFGGLGGIVQICNDLGPGVWEVDGATYTCG
ncbi:DUF4190 domain-containing protein [Microcella sp.]|uniref:DUF4190 domain-containing protein n=1 Tax=Microcella sp. TaxID=1913979 RepID=UPI00299F5DD6|nr:DUF4190 domain-containing protein [Microcella sp.]MDX2025495.1 DUF4190 domain-containing protein [Microcella sp.]